MRIFNEKSIGSSISTLYPVVAFLLCYGFLVMSSFLLCLSLVFLTTFLQSISHYEVDCFQCEIKNGFDVTQIGEWSNRVIEKQAWCFLIFFAPDKSTTYYHFNIRKNQGMNFKKFQNDFNFSTVDTVDTLNESID